MYICVASINFVVLYVCDAPGAGDGPRNYQSAIISRPPRFIKVQRRHIATGSYRVASHGCAVWRGATPDTLRRL